MSHQHYLLHFRIDQVPFDNLHCYPHIQGVVRHTPLKQTLDDIRDETEALVMDALYFAPKEKGQAINICLQTGTTGADTVDEDPAFAWILLG